MTRVLAFFIGCYFLISVSTVLCVAVEQDHINSGSISFKTSHIQWATPLPGGSIRTLTLAAGYVRGWVDGSYTQTGGKIRDVIELVQRADLDMDLVIMQDSFRGFAVPEYEIPGTKEGKQSIELAQQRMEQLVCGEEKYDVVLLANVDFNSLASSLQQAIIQRVKNGAGLVCVQHVPTSIPDYKEKPSGNTEYIFNSAGIEGFDLKSILSSYNYGKGRIVVIQYPEKPLAVTPYLEYSMENQVKYEYWSAWICKVLLWAADRPGDISVASDDVTKSFTLVNKSNETRSLNVTMVVKNDIGEIQSTENHDITLQSKQSKIFRVKTEHLGNGVFHAKVIAENEAGKQGFGALVFEQTKYPKVLLAKTGCQSVELDELFSVTINYEFCKDTTVRIELVTADNRTVYRQELPVRKSGIQSVSMKVTDAMSPTIAMRVRTSLLKDDKVLSRIDTPLTVTLRNQGGFKFVTWGKGRDVLCGYAFEKLREMGFDGCVVQMDPSAVMAANNISQVLYLTSILSDKDENGNLIPYGWNENQTIQAHLKKLLSERNSSTQHGVMFYSLGDEPAYAAIDNSPTTQKAFHEYLRKRYSTIENLNKIWDSSYEDFNQIPVVVKEFKVENNPENRKKQLELSQQQMKGSSARWYDRERFARESFVNIFRQFKPLAKAVDSKALIGFEGAGRMRQGPLIDELVNLNDFWVTYYDTAFNVIRESTEPGNFHCSRWIGYQPQSLVGYSWLNTMVGANGVWFWRWDGMGSRQGLLQPDFSFYPETQVCMDEWKILREGLGDWLVKADRADDGILILNSHESWGASKCGSASGSGDYSWGQHAFMKLFWNLGLGFRYTTPRQIKEGVLSSGDVKLLVLSKQFALDDQTIAEIKHFVADGGAVIADVLPGQYNQYCQLRETSIMQDLFGVSHEAGYDFAPLRLQEKLSECRLDYKTIIDKGTRSHTSQYVKTQNDGPPIWIQNKFGKGVAVLLNFRIDDYPTIKYMRHPEEFLDLMKGLLAQLHVPVSVKVETDNKLPHSKLLISKWNQGDVTLIGLMRNGDANGNETPPARVKITLPEKSIVYSLLEENIQSNRVDAFWAELPYGRARFWAVLNTTMKFDIEKPSSIKIGKPAVYTITAEPSDTALPFYVYLQSPDGLIPNWSRKVLLTSDGKVKYIFTPPFNLNLNQWTIHVKSVFTGEVKKQKIGN